MTEYSSITPYSSADRIFNDEFIKDCRTKINEYNTSPKRGYTHWLTSGVLTTRKLPMLEQNLRKIQTAENCFDLLVSLVKIQTKVGAKGFDALILDLRRSICRELKEKHPAMFNELKTLATAKASECDQHRRNHDCANDGYGDYNGPSLTQIAITEVASATVKRIAEEAAKVKTEANVTCTTHQPAA